MQVLREISTDSVIVNPIARSFDLEFNSLFTSIVKNKSLNSEEKDKAVKSMVFFMKELSRNLNNQRMDLYSIPEVLQSYKTLLNALTTHKPVEPLLTNLEPRRTQILSATFSQYKEYPLIDDIAVYKRVASSPDFILQFLESKPGFKYADSLLVDAASHDPGKIIHYLGKPNNDIQDRIRNTSNPYLKQLVILSSDKSASELMPFVAQIAENRLQPADILENRKEVIKYFQLLVNTLQESLETKTTREKFERTLRKGIREKAMAFYVNQVNELHDAPDAVRFASVKDLRPIDLYYVITSGGEDLYTSSYLGLYKRMMAQLKDRPADIIFDTVHYDNFRTFIRLAANYNVLSDFLSKMPKENADIILKRFIDGVEIDSELALEKAMDIADSFGALATAPDMLTTIQNELKENLGSSKSDKKYLGVRLYSILLQVFDLVKEKDGLHRLWKTLGNYEELKRNNLVNKSGDIIQLVLFYGDEDGIASYNNFLKSYMDSSKWSMKKNHNWISFRSKSPQPMEIYANMPLDIKEEKDLRAQDSLFMYLASTSLEPAILVHRGHSYHLDKTLKRLRPSVKLAILGSCGAYNKAISIATINPDVQVIGSKKTGSKSINDPIINEINETLMDGADISWPQVWKKLESRFSKDEATLNLFKEYFPPSDNVGLFVLKLFNYYNTGNHNFVALLDR